MDNLRVTGKGEEMSEKHKSPVTIRTHISTVLESQLKPIHRQLEDFKKKQDDMFRRMFVGNGKPGLETRVTLLEDGGGGGVTGVLRHLRWPAAAVIITAILAGDAGLITKLLEFMQ
jgi:hypothetical protein